MSDFRLGFPGNEKTVQADVPAGMPPPWDLSTQLKVVGEDHTAVDWVLDIPNRVETFLPEDTR